MKRKEEEIKWDLYIYIDIYTSQSYRVYVRCFYFHYRAHFSLSLSLSLFRYLVQSLFMSFASIFSSRIVPDLIFIEFFDSVPSLRQTFSRNISAPNNISRFFQKHSTIIFSHVPAIYNSFVRCEFYTRQKKKKNTYIEYTYISPKLERNFNILLFISNNIQQFSSILTTRDSFLDPAL